MPKAVVSDSRVAWCLKACLSTLLLLGKLSKSTLGKYPGGHWFDQSLSTQQTGWTSLLWITHFIEAEESAAESLLHHDLSGVSNLWTIISIFRVLTTTELAARPMPSTSDSYFLGWLLFDGINHIFNQPGTVCIALCSYLSSWLHPWSLWEGKKGGERLIALSHKLIGFLSKLPRYEKKIDFICVTCMWQIDIHLCKHFNSWLCVHSAHVGHDIDLHHVGCFFPTRSGWMR